MRARRRAGDGPWRCSASRFIFCAVVKWVHQALSDALVGAESGSETIGVVGGRMVGWDGGGGPGADGRGGVAGAGGSGTVWARRGRRRKEKGRGGRV